MHKKNGRHFWFVVAFAVLVTIIALPFAPYVPQNMRQHAEKLAINLGLDLQGGLHLEYKLDLSKVPHGKVGDAQDAVQAVVERRVNAYGVGEPVVQLAQRGGETFLIVEFPGAERMEDVKNVIQKTPFLEFRVEKTEEEKQQSQAEQNEELKDLLGQIDADAKKKADDALARIVRGDDFETVAKETSRNPDAFDIAQNTIALATKEQYDPAFAAVLFDDNMHDGDVHNELVETDQGWFIIKKRETQGDGDDKKITAVILPFAKAVIPVDPYKPTELTGEYLDHASVEFGGANGGISEPQVSLQFNAKGKELFAQITKEHLHERVAIYLDDEVVSAPTVQSEIVDGRAVITGHFTTQEAKDLAQRLNEGALPVPIELVSQKSVEATLGAVALQRGLKAGMVGLILVMMYMIFYYRLFGVIASVALGIYAAMIITLFKLSSVTPLSVTLTLAGIAGLILSIGMAVDANVLIFERIKEEIRRGKSLKRAIDEGFKRAWSSIRDGNLSTMITSIILMSMGTGFVKGFALILIIGVLLSMFTAIVLVKIIVKYMCGAWIEKHLWCIIRNKKKE